MGTWGDMRRSRDALREQSRTDGGLAGLLALWSFQPVLVLGVVMALSLMVQPLFTDMPWPQALIGAVVILSLELAIAVVGIHGAHAKANATHRPKHARASERPGTSGT
jgi:hypothetical protein